MIIFIIATVGLLGYAIASPWVSKWVDVGSPSSLAHPLQLRLLIRDIDSEKTQICSVADILMVMSTRQVGKRIARNRKVHSMVEFSKYHFGFWILDFGILYL